MDLQLTPRQARDLAYLSGLVYVVCQATLLQARSQQPGVYLLWLAAFMGLLLSLPRTRGWQRLLRMDPGKALLLLFVLGLAARWVMLATTQTDAKDMELLVERTRKVLEGQTPYSDTFIVNKPPLYIYTLYAMGLVTGANKVPLRALLSLVDALSIFVVFWLIPVKWNPGGGEVVAGAGRSVQRSESVTTVNNRKGSGVSITYSHRLLAGLGLALCPANIFMIGFSGHYEPFVVLSVLLALGFHLRGRQGASALLLGLGFAWKFYPLFILPFILLRLRTRYGRGSYVLLFSLPFLVSLVPILLLEPQGLYDYFFGYQGGDWVEHTLRGFPAGLAVLSGTSGMGLLSWSNLSVLLFGLALVLFMAGRYARDPRRPVLPGRLERAWQRLTRMVLRLDPAVTERVHLARWADRALLLLLAYHLVQWVQEGVLHPPELGRARGALIVLWGTFILVYLYRSPHWPRLSLDTKAVTADHFTQPLERSQALLLSSSIAVLLVLWGSPDFTAWYSLWLLPLVMLLPRSWGRWWFYLLLLANIP